MNEHDKLSTAQGIKSTAVEIKDVDETNRIVKGYLSSFNTKDSDNDVIRKGAFKKSLKERGVNSKANRRIAHLRSP